MERLQFDAVEARRGYVGVEHPGPRPPPSSPSSSPRPASLNVVKRPVFEEKPWHTSSGKAVLATEDPPEEVLGRRHSERRRVAHWAERLFRSTRELEAGNLRLKVQIERAHVEEQLVRAKLEDSYCKGEHSERVLGHPATPSREENSWLRKQLAAYQDEVAQLRSAIAHANAEADSAQVMECRAEQERIKSADDAERKRCALEELKKRSGDQSQRVQDEENAGQEASTRLERLQAQLSREEQRLNAMRALAAEQPRRHQALLSALDARDARIREIQDDVVEPLWSLVQRLRSTFEAAAQERLAWALEVWAHESVANECSRQLQELTVQLLEYYNDIVGRVRGLWTGLERSWPLASIDDATQSFDREVSELRASLQKQVEEAGEEEDEMLRLVTSGSGRRVPRSKVLSAKRATVGIDEIRQMIRGSKLTQVVGDVKGNTKCFALTVSVQLGEFPRLVCDSGPSRFYQRSAQGFQPFDLRGVISMSWGFASRAYALWPEAKPWRCFSISSITDNCMDFVADNDRAVQCWVLGLSRLCPAAAIVRSRHELLFRRGLMRVDDLCRRRCTTRRQVLLDAVLKAHASQNRPLPLQSVADRPLPFTTGVDRPASSYGYSPAPSSRGPHT